jgi:hypothetical protein
MWAEEIRDIVIESYHQAGDKQLSIHAAKMIYRN